MSCLSGGKPQEQTQLMNTAYVPGDVWEGVEYKSSR